jgi:hypothetical protein
MRELFAFGLKCGKRGESRMEEGFSRMEFLLMRGEKERGADYENQ